VICACCGLPASWGQTPKPSEATSAGAATPALDAASLVKKLEDNVGKRLDVELKSGKAYVRASLAKVTWDAKAGVIKELRIQDADTNRIVSLGFASIRTLTLEREKIYEAPATGRPTAQTVAAERAAKAAEKEKQEWLARLKIRGIEPWPELTPSQHEQEVAELRKQIEAIQKVFPDMALYETHEFLFLSNMPRDQVVPYAASLDKMYDMMCAMYRIKRGTPVWKGKCLVTAFLEKEQFMRYESDFKQVDATGAQGLCHSRSNGDVEMACYRGSDPIYFGQVLVHETSHGFIHRYRTAERLPSWVNEGMAEWIALSLVPSNGGIARKRDNALEQIRSTGSLTGLLTAQPISAPHYGMAYNLTNFLIQTDKAKYAGFIDGMKEGKTWEESLKDSYGATADQLVASYGKSIGVPSLRP